MTREQALELIEIEIRLNGGQSATAKKLGISQARVSAGLKQDILPEILMGLVGIRKVISYENQN